MDTMQGATWANGQCRQVGQLQSAHPPHLSHNTSSNHGSNAAASFLPSSNNGVGAMVGHFSMQGVGTKQLSTQRQNILTADNQLPASGHQSYPNSTQNATFIATPTANIKQQVMYTQNTLMSENQLTSMQVTNVEYYKPQVMHQGLNQNLNSRTENVTAHMKNPTSASTTQAVHNMQQQTPLQSCMYSQPSLQSLAGGPQTLPSYSQAVSAKSLYIASSHVPSAQNVYTAIPVTQFATSFGYKSTTNKSDQANYIVPQKNAFQPLHGCTLFVPNNASSLGNSPTTVPVQTHCNFNQNQEHMQQLAVGGNGALQTTQPVIPTTNCNAFSMGLPSPTEKTKEQFQLKNRLAPSQTIATTNDQPNNPSVNLTSMFYKKINCVQSVNPNVPLYRASQNNRGEALEKIETVLAGQANNGAMLTSPGRAQRAVAVVLPLSQETASDDHQSPANKPSPNASSSPSFFSSDQRKNAQHHTPDASCLKEKSPKLTSDCDVPSENANVQNPSPSLKRLLSMDDSPPRLSNLPLTFAKLVREGTTPQALHISGRQKNSVNRNTQTETKPCQEPLSSVPTTEWTLGKLYLKIQLMENANEKCENKIDPVDKRKAVKEMLIRFWNGDWKKILIAVRSGNCFHQTKAFKELCSTVTKDTVILSQLKSQNIQNSQYHVLQHDEVYKEEIPYISSWLNINRQLDDIDKEFGLPYFWKCGQEFDYSDYKDADTQRELQDNFQAGLKSVNSEEPVTQSDKLDQGIKSVESKSTNIDAEIQNELKPSETDSPKDSDENQCESNVESSDPNYSFKIEVLSPEKAKVIFEQMDPQMARPSKVEATVPNDQNDAKRPTCSATTLETVCCIEKWKEKVFGLASEGTCKCKVIHEDKEPQLHSADDNSWTMDFFDLTKDDRNGSTIVPLEATGDMQEDRSPNNKSVILVLSESEDEGQVSKDNQTQANDNGQNFAESAEDSHVAIPDKNALDTSILLFHESETTVSKTTCIKEQEMKEQNEDCRMKTEKTAGFVAEKKQNTQEAENATILPVSPSDAINKHGKKPDEDIPDPSSSRPSKRLKPSSHLRSQTIFESFSKCINTAPIATVELALFGSRQEKCASLNTRRSHNLFDKALQPPERIYVKMNPLTSDQEKEPLSNMSVKRRIHENWMKSFPLTTIKIRKKRKSFAIVGNNTPLNPFKLKLKGTSPKSKVKDSDDGLYRKRKRTHSIEKSVDLLKKPDIEVKPLEENILKFNVLPSTFSFEDGPQNVDSMTDSAAADEKTLIIPDKAEVKTLVKTQGAWCDESRDRSPIQSPASSTESLVLFQEFQKKHKMRRSSTD